MNFLSKMNSQLKCQIRTLLMHKSQEMSNIRQLCHVWDLNPGPLASHYAPQSTVPPSTFRKCFERWNIFIFSHSPLFSNCKCSWHEHIFFALSLPEIWWHSWLKHWLWFKRFRVWALGAAEFSKLEHCASSRSKLITWADRFILEGNSCNVKFNTWLYALFIKVSHIDPWGCKCQI